MTEQQSSFIPKAPMRAQMDKPRSGKVYILTYVSVVFLLGALMATAIVFFYGLQAQRKLTEQQNKFDQEFQQFDSGVLAEVTELSVRLSEAKSLLNQTVSPVRLMNALEVTLVQSVTVSSLTLNKQDDGTYLLELNARAPEFNAVRYQRDLISANLILAGAEITETVYGADSAGTENQQVVQNDISKDTVAFTISKTLTPDIIAHLTTPSVTDYNGGGTAEDTTVTTDDDLSLVSDEADDVVPADTSVQDTEISN